jgi:AbrB family looped-hinge helix DNA binding protein
MTMKTTLNAEGQIIIPKQIRDSDHLIAGDSFELQRLTSGFYVLSKQSSERASLRIETAEDGLPVIRGNSGIITTAMVREIESQTM